MATARTISTRAIFQTTPDGVFPLMICPERFLIVIFGILFLCVALSQPCANRFAHSSGRLQALVFVGFAAKRRARARPYSQLLRDIAQSGAAALPGSGMR